MMCNISVVLLVSLIIGLQEANVSFSGTSRSAASGFGVLLEEAADTPHSVHLWLPADDLSWMTQYAGDVPFCCRRSDGSWTFTPMCDVIFDALLCLVLIRFCFSRLHDPSSELREPIAPVNTFKGLITLAPNYSTEEFNCQSSEIKSGAESL